jgi:hypothetical protein
VARVRRRRRRDPAPRALRVAAHVTEERLC